MYKRCRVCLKKQIEIKSIYEHETYVNLPKIIYNISGVKILARNEPNARICVYCAKAVVAAQKIIIKCQESEQYLEYKRIQQQKRQTQESATPACNNFLVYDSENEDNAHTDESAYNDAETNVAYEQIEQNVVSAESSHIKSSQKIRDATKTPRFECEHCDFYSKTGKVLIAHMLEEHQIDDPNIYACTLCNERFSWKPSLYRHIEQDHNILPEEKKFICKECGKAYLRDVHLHEHIKQRHGPRRFKCAEPKCDQTFTRAFTLRRHFISAHTSQTRYHCTDCDKYFKIYDLWKYHNEVVHKNSTVYCPRCGYPFRYKEKLEEHLEKDVCIRSVIPCLYCQRKFTAQTGLREHLKNIHHMA